MNKIAALQIALTDLLAGPYLVGAVILLLGVWLTEPLLVTAGVLLAVCTIAIALIVTQENAH